MSLPPPSPDDEIVSAVLDGEATPDERARVEADPRLRARLDRLRSVRDAVAAPVAPLDELTTERMRGVAVAAAAPSASEAEADWTAARARRTRRWWSDPTVLGVAAVVLLLLLAVPVLSSLDLGSGDDSDTSADGGLADTMSAESADVEEQARAARFPVGGVNLLDPERPAPPSSTSGGS